MHGVAVKTDYRGRTRSWNELFQRVASKALPDRRIGRRPWIRGGGGVRLLRWPRNWIGALSIGRRSSFLLTWRLQISVLPGVCADPHRRHMVASGQGAAKSGTYKFTSPGTASFGPSEESRQLESDVLQASAVGQFVAVGSPYLEHVSICAVSHEQMATLRDPGRSPSGFQLAHQLVKAGRTLTLEPTSSPSRPG
jgi:hypothetical protein